MDWRLGINFGNKETFPTLALYRVVSFELTFRQIGAKMEVNWHLSSLMSGINYGDIFEGATTLFGFDIEKNQL